MSRRGTAKPEKSAAEKLRERYVGRRVAYAEREGGCEWYARVIDASVPYGRRRLLLEPEAGEGLDWYGLERCRVITEGRSDAITKPVEGRAAEPTA